MIEGRKMRVAKVAGGVSGDTMLKSRNHLNLDA